GIDDDEQGQRGRPQGSMNKEKRFTLDDTKATRFRRWAKANPELGHGAFKAFLASTANNDLSTKERAAMYEKYEKAAKKKQK
ncbi:type III restriction endonuclease subunit R, partial [Escherichia coli]|nr:type III restriction endonuclease subunit R [Escherichia coli]